tara:strand:+ start:6516 stop:6752 length:237 start_codon:yes stop_codon:yes gene_type:complete
MKTILPILAIVLGLSSCSPSACDCDYELNSRDPFQSYIDYDLTFECNTKYRDKIPSSFQGSEFAKKVRELAAKECGEH